MTARKPIAERTSATNQAVVRQIKMALAGRDWHQSDLAEALGQNEKWISRRLRCECPLSLDELDSIATALEVAAADLLAGAQPEGARGYRVIPSVGQTASENRPDNRPSPGEESPGRASSPRRPRRLIPAQRAMPQQRLAAA